MTNDLLAACLFLTAGAKKKKKPDCPLTYFLQFSKYGDYCDYFCAHIDNNLIRKYVNEESE